MSSLRILLKEYLELNDKTIDEFIDIVVTTWQPIIYNKLPPTEATEVMEELIGIPDLTKSNH